MVNPGAMLQMMNLWNRFKNNHPKFPNFLSAVSQSGIAEGSVIEINITTNDGKKISSNLKISADDMQILNELRSLAPNGR